MALPQKTDGVTLLFGRDIHLEVAGAQRTTSLVRAVLKVLTLFGRRIVSGPTPGGGLIKIAVAVRSRGCSHRDVGVLVMAKSRKTASVRVGIEMMDGLAQVWMLSGS